MHLFLIRHGESWTNVHWREIEHNYQLNSHLTEDGKLQASKMATWMQSTIPELKAIYTSTLHRTLETAAPLEVAYGLTAIRDHRLREGGYCYASGEPIPDELLPIYKRVDFHQNPFTPFEMEPTGVESFDHLRSRIGHFLTDLKQNHIGDTVAAITHGWTMNAFIDVIFNIPQYRSVLVDIENTAISWFEFDPKREKGPWRLHFLGHTPHLDIPHRSLRAFEMEAS